MTSRISASVWTGLKVAASLGLLGFLGWRARDSLASMASVRLDVLPLLGVLAILVVATALNALRWRLVARSMELGLGFASALRLTFGAQFASQIMPGIVGLDLVRGAGACWIGLPAQKVISSIIVDRLISLVGVALMVTVSVPLLVGRIDRPLILLLGGAVAALYAAIAALLIVDRLPFVTGLLVRRGAVLLSMAKSMRRALVSRDGIGALILAVTVQLMAIYVLALLARALSFDLAILDALVVLPASLLLASLPISINGWGVREGALVFGLGLLGVDEGQALTLSILFGLSTIASALPGAAIWLTLRKAPRELRSPEESISKSIS